MQLDRSARNEVWTILMKNGLELISQLAVEPTVVGGGDQRLFLHKPFTMRTINIPMQTPEGININTKPQMQPFVWTLMLKDLPLYPEDVWYMTSAPKGLQDAYLQETSGIILGG